MICMPSISGSFMSTTRASKCSERDFFQGGLPGVGHHGGYHLLFEEAKEQGDLLIPVHNQNLTGSVCHCAFSPQPEGG